VERLSSGQKAYLHHRWKASLSVMESIPFSHACFCSQLHYKDTKFSAGRQINLKKSTKKTLFCFVKK